MRCLLFILAFITMDLVSLAQDLKVSRNGRYLETSSEKQFVWIGDTAWELFHRLTREEADEYLRKRAQQGFTVIQAVALAENDGLRTPNAYGEVPLHGLNPDTPNEKYFEHVDYIVNRANELGLYVGLLPTWGDKLFSRNPGAGPIVFNPRNSRTFGEYLGRRYKDKRLVWILGGDRNVDSQGVLECWREMAKGLKNGDGGAHLIGYHPRGAVSSSLWLHNESWLDFNIYQSGHEKRFQEVYRFAQRDYLKNPVKPVIDGEPAYEDIPVSFWEFCDWNDPRRVPKGVTNSDGIIVKREHFSRGFFTDYDVRVHGYWNLLSGACGYTYGNNAVWQMFKKGGYVAIPALTDWREALDRDGANQLRYMRNIFETRPISSIVPDQSVVYGQNPEDSSHVRSATALNNKSLLVYLAVGQPVSVYTGKVTDSKLNGYWYNPRDGKVIAIGEFDNKTIMGFSPPSSGINNDWLLVIDSKAAKLPSPAFAR